MTITLTIEEVKQYQAKCLQWMIDRSEYVISVAPFKRGVGGEHHERDIESARKEIAKWDAEHPAPKILPSI